MSKSTVDEIRQRFDNDVERFSDLQAGQVATIDSPMHLDLLTEAAAAVTPHAKTLLDIGCGAGNYTLKLLERISPLDVTLIDLSKPMLDRAIERIGGQVQAIQGDIRQIDLGEERFDIVMAGQVLHHLRDESEWRDVFARIFAAIRPGGSLWIADSLVHEHAGVEAKMHRRWGEYLAAARDEAYRDHVFAYVKKEDTPRPLTFQLDLMRSVGFEHVDVLHKNNRFASFGGVKNGGRVPSPFKGEG